ncbi:hypothetical protein HYH02_012506 [Chlamydomonas schloesseri]|uniref:PDEase domain-containing protein n=1 Tax=Chlamydomonas schloesseri TaxID=2026947 RepID=A0A835VYG9_9CHLO|nr:hypothetical protein HYH02_012506 [Chlamydomonas schloesseri]|eukprot:KAG2433962.1 hypothetical protein HYH02_012506 [Chlamydomonas schloesseri]
MRLQHDTWQGLRNSSGANAYNFSTTVHDQAFLTPAESALSAVAAMGYAYRLSNARTGVVVASYGGAGEPRDPVSAAVQLATLEWKLEVWEAQGWQPAWVGGALAAVFVLAAIAALLLAGMLVSRRRHALLLEALLPRDLLKELSATHAETLGPAGPLDAAASPAGLLLGLLGDLMAGAAPDLRQVVTLRSLALRQADWYRPLGVVEAIKEAHLESDVARALMRQLGTGADISTTRGITSSAPGAAEEDSAEAAAAAAHSGGGYGPSGCTAAASEPASQQQMHSLRGALAFMLSPAARQPPQPLSSTPAASAAGNDNAEALPPAAAAVSSGLAAALRAEGSGFQKGGGAVAAPAAADDVAALLDTATFMASGNFDGLLLQLQAQQQVPRALTQELSQTPVQAAAAAAAAAVTRTTGSVTFAGMVMPRTSTPRAPKPAAPAAARLMVLAQQGRAAVGSGPPFPGIAGARSPLDAHHQQNFKRGLVTIPNSNSGELPRAGSSLLQPLQQETQAPAAAANSSGGAAGPLEPAAAVSSLLLSAASLEGAASGRVRRGSLDTAYEAAEGGQPAPLQQQLQQPAAAESQGRPVSTTSVALTLATAGRGAGTAASTPIPSAVGAAAAAGSPSLLSRLTSIARWPPARGRKASGQGAGGGEGDPSGGGGGYYQRWSLLRIQQSSQQLADDGSGGQDGAASPAAGDGGMCSVSARGGVHGCVVLGSGGGGGEAVDAIIGAAVVDDAASPFALPPAALLDQVELLLARAGEWQYDSWALAQASGGHALSAMGFYLLQSEGLVAAFKLQPVRLARLLRALEDGYPASNPYHNATHAADVLRTLSVLLRGARLTAHYAHGLGLLAAYFAAIIHDHGHPGLTGDFLVYLVATSHPLALRYNDRSPLESHHAASAFTLLSERPDLDPFVELSKEQRGAFRKQVIDMVLATDMKQHFSLLTQFTSLQKARKAGLSGGTRGGGGCVRGGGGGAAGKSAAVMAGESLTRTPPAGPQQQHHQPGQRLLRPPHSRAGGEGISSSNNVISDESVAAAAAVMPPPSLVPSSAQLQMHVHSESAPMPQDEAERSLALQIALKAADIGHLAGALPVHCRWLGVLEEEFFRQGDRERALGLPISPLFDRTKQGVSKSQGACNGLDSDVVPFDVHGAELCVMAATQYVAS